MHELSFHDICYSVTLRKKICCGRGGDKTRINKKQILFNVSGIFRQGMNAILGPTGCGKTTLLDVLSDRMDRVGIEGRVMLDGRAIPKNFKFTTGYVVQDDVVMGTLTVRESLMFSANLRLPSYMTTMDKKIKVDEVLGELGLTKCADTKIGTEFIRGISGGERKRVCIGMELVISPSILYLDEPTTGLDASTANSVMRLLHVLSKNGRTIIFSIHQPRYSIFKYFDTLLLLGNGRTIYHGPAPLALNYFENIGYQCEPHNNPPDFFMDVISDELSTKQKQNQQQHQHEYSNAAYNPNLSDDNKVNIVTHFDNNISNNNTNNNNNYNNIKHNNSNNSLEDADVDNSIKLFELYQQSDFSRDLDHDMKKIIGEYNNENNNNNNNGVPVMKYPTSALKQTGYVSIRTLKNLVRNPQTFVLQITISILFALIVGIIYLQLGNEFESAIQNRLGALLFIIMNQIFGSMSIIELFIKERHIFVHESASGYYRVSAYFFSKVLCDIIPMRLLPVTIFAPISYFMIGFQASASKFFIYYLFIFLTSLAGASLGIVISSSVSILAIANLLISLCYVLMMLFGGLFVNLETMADWLSWLQYLSIVRYSTNALAINELKDLVLYKTINGTRIELPDVGKEFLKAQGIRYETNYDLWQNGIALILMIIIFLFLGYVKLRTMKKLK